MLVLRKDKEFEILGFKQDDSVSHVQMRLLANIKAIVVPFLSYRIKKGNIGIQIGGLGENVIIMCPVY